MHNLVALDSNLWLKSLICIACSYIIGTIGIKFFLNYIHNKSICRQPIRSDGPQNHITEKKNTPTFGGVFIAASTLITSFLFIDNQNHYFWPITLFFTIFALIGFTDDFLKVFYKNVKGFKGSIKLIIQFLVIGIAYIWLGQIDDIHNNTRIFLPIMDGISVKVGAPIYILFVTTVIVGTANSTNLTDGLDGLLGVPAIIALSALIILIIIASDPELSQKYTATHIKNADELLFFCLALIGAIIAFLQFNLKPAKIFMGDTGSLAIGAVLGLIAVIIKQELVFFVISLVFVAETISVILQVASYKIRQKRIFLMAPIHHHFEKKGWGEKKVVRTFWLISLICAITGVSIIAL